MCRLFGFRSVLESQVHRSLRSADNALATQSVNHPDGWGVAYYVAGAPHIIKSTGAAQSDRLFHRVSGIVTSQTVVAHVRKATQGTVSTLNCHPFQYGRWVMAHNGDIPNFGRYRDALVEQVSPVFRRFLLGDTDSEVIFHLILSDLATHTDLHRHGCPIEVLMGAVQRTVALVRAAAGDDGAAALLTLVITDGAVMAAHQGGKELYWTTHKERCPERETCPFLAPACESSVVPGAYVNHLVVSSEPLLGENVWNPLAPGELVGVDPFMRFHRALPAAAPGQ